VSQGRMRTYLRAPPRLLLGACCARVRAAACTAAANAPGAMGGVTSTCPGAGSTLTASGCRTGTAPAPADSTSQASVTLMRGVQRDMSGHAGDAIVPKLITSGARVSRKRKSPRMCARGAAASPSSSALAQRRPTAWPHMSLLARPSSALRRAGRCCRPWSCAYVSGWQLT